MATVIALPTSYRPAARPAADYRLTRRGRLVVFVLGLVLAAAAVFAWSSVAEATGSSGEAPQYRLVYVHAGDTLWDLAASVAHGGDIRAAQRRIMDLNGLSSGALQVGQQLRLPAE